MEKDDEIKMLKVGLLITVVFLLCAIFYALKNMPEYQNNYWFSFTKDCNGCDTTYIIRATTYNTEPSQTDSTPNHTADGSYIDPVKLFNKELRWIALSRDLIWDDYRQSIYSDTTLWRGPWKFGDTISLYSDKFPNLDGDWVVHDCMHDTARMSIDFLMDPRNNIPKLGIGRDVKIIYCGEE
jgi:hypothetical protein